MIIWSAVVLITGIVVSCFLVGIAGSCLVMITGGSILVLFLLYTKKRYEDINELNTYLSEVLAGDYNLQTATNEEGELSILQNNLYKATILLQSQNEQLIKDKIYLADVMADISHQLKTPLTSMGMMNELLEGELSAASKDSEQGRARQFLDIQRQQVDKMNWLVQNLLKLSKLDAGIVELKREKIDFEEMIEESLHPFLVQMELAGMHLEKGSLCGSFEGDRNWTIEVLRNVIKNCIEHMDKQGVLKIRTKEESLYSMIEICDNGCGISKEDLPHIFERFYRGKDASPGSIGIGLALAKTILEKERGVILAESSVGEGTRFEIRFYKAVI